MRPTGILLLLAALLPAAEAPTLPVLGDQYPRAFFFRAAESMAARGTPYDEWEKAFDRLMGIEGKALDEEVPKRSVHNIEYFSRFKQRHPDQLVMLHYNGNARDPRYDAAGFFAGHWLYFNGAHVTRDLRAAAGESDLAVDNPALFKTGIGRYQDANEDIAVCALDARGKPDWNACEQVQLVSVNAAARTLRIRRGAYGTVPRAFAAGQAYAAAHVTEGPWGKGSNLLWHYNYSTKSPRDPHGRSCADALSANLAKHFAPGADLAAFDGLEFDVLQDRARQRDRGRGVDADGDGLPDAGIVGGVNYYGIGVVEFCRQLRTLMGLRKLILADGMAATNQRAFGILNGIESEGFPSLRDMEMEDWSGGINRHMFWAQNAAPPVFNYINHKFNDPANGLPARSDIPPGIDRLVFAAAVFTDAAVCYSSAPQPEPDEKFGIWDELVMGTERRIAWLGRAAGPAVHLAAAASPLLERGSLRLDHVVDGDLAYTLKGVPTGGPDLFVTFTVKGQPLPEYPRERARLMWVAVGKQRFLTWVNDRDFRATFAFSQVAGSGADIEFSVEGAAPVTVSSLRVTARPDAMYREFEHGLVLANPSPRPYTFEIPLLRQNRYRRLRGSAHQDPRTNDGSDVAGPVKLGPKDALFLVKR